MINVLVFIMGCLFGTAIFMIGRMSVRKEWSNDVDKAIDMMDVMIDKYVDKIKEAMDL